MRGPRHRSVHCHDRGATVKAPLFFVVHAVAGYIERNCVRENTLEGQVAAAKGNHGGRPKSIDDDMPTWALALKNKGVPVPDTARKLTIKRGENADRTPSAASLYRSFAEAEQAAAQGTSRLCGLSAPGSPAPGSTVDPDLK